jgi:hypothetical protein
VCNARIEQLVSKTKDLHQSQHGPDLQQVSLILASSELPEFVQQAY